MPIFKYYSLNKLKSHRMSALAVLWCLIMAPFTLQSQVLTNKGAVINIKEKTVVQVTDVENASGRIINNGTVQVAGDWNDNAEFSDSVGTIIFNGSRLQRIFKRNGLSFYNFKLNSTGDAVMLQDSLKINGTTQIEKGQVSTQYSIEFLGEVMCGNGTINATAGEVNYPVKAQRIIAGTYYNLTLKGNSVKYLCGNVHVLNNLTIVDGALELGSYDLIVDKQTIINGNLSDSVKSGNVLFKGPVVINEGGRWNFTGNNDVEFQNGVKYNGSKFISGTGTYKFTVNDQAIQGKNALTFDAKVDISAKLTNKLIAALSLKNQVDGTGTFENQGIISYSYSDVPMKNGHLDASFTGNTFRYSGAKQGIAAGTSNGNYYYLIITGSNIKTFEGDLQVSGKLVVENKTKLAFGTSAAYTLKVLGDLHADSGIIDISKNKNLAHSLQLFGTNNTCDSLTANLLSTVEYIGNTDQKIFASQNYPNINFGGSGKKLLQGAIKVSGNKVKLSTNVESQGNMMYIANGSAVVERTSGAFIGNIKRHIDKANFSYLFPIGTDTSYNSLQFDFASVKNSGDYITEFHRIDPGNNGLPLRDVDEVDVYDRFANGYWTVKSQSSVNTDSFTISLNAEKFGVDISSRIIHKTQTNFNATGYHEGLLDNLISRANVHGFPTDSIVFAIGKGRPTILKSPINDTVCYNTDGHFSVRAGGQKPLSYQWYKFGNPTPLSNGAKYAGANTSNLTVLNATFNDQHTFYCAVTDGAGHTVNSDTARLKVKEIPVVRLLAHYDTICNNGFATIPIAKDITDTTYSWTVSQASNAGGASKGSGILINQQLWNNNLFVAEAIYTIQAKGPAPTYCLSKPMDDTIRINPTPQLSAVAVHDVLCHNEGVGFNVNSLIRATKKVKYHLEVTDNPNIKGKRNNGDYDMGEFSDPLVNTSTSVQKISYTFIPYIEDLNAEVNNCENGIVTKVDVYINPQPKISLPATDTTICYSEGINIAAKNENPKVIGTWVYDVFANASTDSLIGYTKQDLGKTGDFTQQTIRNLSYERQWIDYTFVPRIENPRAGLNNCEDEVNVKKTIRVYVNPQPAIYAETSEDTLCYDENITFVLQKRNGQLNGSWRYNLKVTADSVDIVGLPQDTLSSNYNDVMSFNTRLINNSWKKQQVSFHFMPVIKDPRAYLSDCGLGKDVTINVYINPQPKIRATFDNLFTENGSLKYNLYCDSSTANLNVQSMNGEVMGERYYSVQTVYDTSKIRFDQSLEGYHAVGSYHQQLINTSDTVQRVTYKIKAHFRDPKGTNYNNYCSTNNEIDTSIIVEVLPVLKATLLPTIYAGGYNIKCFGDNTGEIKLNLSGGMVSKGMGDTNASYVWSNNATTRDIKNLYRNSYSVNVKDTWNCQTSNSVSLKEPSKLDVRAFADASQNCTNSAAGTITATRRGGTLPYMQTYWMRGSTPVSHIPNVDTVINNLSVGSDYVCYVIDANACQDTGKAMFHNIGTFSGWDIRKKDYVHSDTAYNVSCPGAADALLNPDIAIDNKNVLYKWYRVTATDTTLLSINPPENALKNVGAGIYILNISLDDGYCSSSRTDTVFEPPLITYKDSVSRGLNENLQITCDDSNDGFIIVNAKAGKNKLDYSWTSPDTAITSNTNAIQDLKAGTYNLLISDSWNVLQQDFGTCTLRLSYELKKPQPLALENEISDFNGVNVSCFGSKDGYINATLSGGVAPYTYTWIKDGVNLPYKDASIDKLEAGVYTLKAGYGKSCGRSFQIELKEPALIQNDAKLSLYPGEPDSINISCFNGNNGSIEANIRGGIGPYTYSWTNEKKKVVSTTTTAQKLIKAHHFLLVKDANKCEYTETFTLVQPDDIFTKVGTTSVSCNADQDGTAWIESVSGGTPKYTFKWSTNSTDTMITGLSKNSYFVISTDRNNCKDTVSFNITEPLPLTLSLNKAVSYNEFDISCYGRKDGAIQAVVKGGTQPFSYYWNRRNNDSITVLSQNSSLLDSLPFGSYWLRVVDKAKCTDSTTIVLKEPEALRTKIKTTDVHCYSGTDGGIEVEVSGGAKPYNYLWNNNATDSYLENITMGYYSVNVYDENGCFIQAGDTVKQPTDLRISYKNSKSPYCPATFDGWAMIRIVGGVKPYLVNWEKLNSKDFNNKQLTGDSIKGLNEGDYMYTVVDSNKCTIIDTVHLSATHSTCLDIPTAFSPNGDGRNDTWNILAGDPAHYQALRELFKKAVVEVYNRWGELVYKSSKGYTNEWDGRSGGKMLPMDSYYYSIDLGDGSEKWIGIVSIIK